MTITNTRPFSAASFYQYIAEGKLMASRCASCDALYLPPRAICPGCHTDVLEWTELSGNGKLAAFTSIYIAPTFMIKQGFGRDKPYLTGIVALQEGPMISSRILGLDATNPQAHWIGMPMVVEFHERVEGEQEMTEMAFRIK